MMYRNAVKQLNPQHEDHRTNQRRAVRRKGPYKMTGNGSHEAPSWKGREPVSIRFGRRLHGVREQRGYTQMQLAMNAGLDRSFISDMERGVKEPTISTLDILAVTFNLTLSELLDTV